MVKSIVSGKLGQGAISGVAEVEADRALLLRHLHESVVAGVRPFRTFKNDAELFAKVWNDAAVALGLTLEGPDASLIVRRAFWGRSLDASILLVERILPDWTWSVERYDDVDDGQPYWSELRPSTSGQGLLDDDCIQGSGWFPAGAILSALLNSLLRQ